MPNRVITFKAVLLAFLRAELDSPSERQRLRATLVRLRAPEEIIVGDSADAESLWRIFTAYRGLESVFDGLDLRALVWCRTELTLDDLEAKTFTCVNHFLETYRTRRPIAIARAWNESGLPNGVLAKIRRGEKLEPPILVGDTEMQRLVILEGHNRLISYLRDPDTVQFPLTVIVGTSSNVSLWCQW